jgi:DNA primase
MKNKLANLEEVIQKLRSFLPQYLAEFDIDPNNNFSCLNPRHEDSNPSMSCAQNPENAYCFSCGVTCDIFQAAHWLEDKPISGPGFIEDNIKYLADHFGVELELEEMTEDELYRYRTYRAYQAAADIVAN